MVKTPEYYKTLAGYASTHRQTEVMNLLAEHLSQTKVAELLNVTSVTVCLTLKAVEKRAAKRGFAPDHNMTQVAPEGFAVKGTSTLYDQDGNAKIQWVKTNQSQEQQLEAMKEASQAFIDELPKAEPVRHSGNYHNANLLNQYTVTDYHLGMKAWAKEAGDDWDTDIAEKLLVDWFATAIELSPNAQTAILAQLGDFLHWDGVDAVTPASGHLLDADTRFQRIIRVAIRVTRKIVEMLLEKHGNVHIIMAEGNHDPASSMWLREWLRAHYDDEPRITVDDSARPYYCYEHGETALFYHHGHKRKLANIDSVFAGLFREVFGRTKHAYAHMGHLHSVDMKETNLMIVEQHRTLAAPDAYAARGGWLSGRDAKVITYHKEFGEVGRLSISPDMVNNHGE